MPITRIDASKRLVGQETAGLPYKHHSMGLPPLVLEGSRRPWVEWRGTFRLKHKLLFNANALKQQYIGLEEIEDAIWSIHFGTVLLGRIDEKDMRIYG